MKNFLLYVVCFILVTVLILVFFPFDDKEVNDADLAVVKSKNVPDEENMHKMLVEFKDEMSSDKVMAVFPYDRTEGATQQDIIDTRPLAISLAETIFSIESFACGYTGISECDWNLMRDIGSFLLIHAEQYVRVGQVVNAERMYDASIKLATAIAEQPSVTIIDLLIAIAIINQAKALVAEGVISNSFINEIKQKYDLSEEALMSAYKFEYQLKKSEDFYHDSLALKVNYLYQPNKTLNQHANFTRKQLALAEQECGSSAAKKRMTDLEKEVYNFPYPLGGFTSFILPNLVGRMEIYITLTTQNVFYGKYCEAKTFLE